jgi:hypothetical protein
VRFDPSLLADLDEPVRRYFAHALREGAPLDQPTHLRMTGRIKVGKWLPFSATQDNDRDSFRWSARLGAGPLTVLRVVDRYAAGRGSTEGRLLGRARLFRADDEHATRSAAARTALEAATFAPACLLPHTGVTWRAEGDDVITAAWSVPPERPEVRIRIDARGAIRSVSALRWGDQGHGRHGYIPCGCEVHQERRFGDFVVPSHCTVGWWFGTPRYTPFFRADVTSLGLSPGACAVAAAT